MAPKASFDMYKYSVYLQSTVEKKSANKGEVNPEQKFWCAFRNSKKQIELLLFFSFTKHPETFKSFWKYTPGSTDLISDALKKLFFWWHSPFNDDFCIAPFRFPILYFMISRKAM